MAGRRVPSPAWHSGARRTRARRSRALGILRLLAIPGIVGAFLAPSPLEAQGTPPGGGGPWLEVPIHVTDGQVVVTRLPVSTRSLGLGGGLPLAQPDPDHFLRNAAMAERGRGMAIAYHGYEARSRLLVMTAGTAWLGGGVGLGIRHAAYPMAESQVGASAPRTSAAHRMRRSPGDPQRQADVSETVVTAGYGRLVRGVRVGMALSGLEVRRGTASGTAGFVDAGLAVDVSRFTVGLSGGGVGSASSLPQEFRTVPAWGTLALASQTAPLRLLDFTGAFALTWREGGEVEAGGGIELGWWMVEGRTFVGRVGLGGDLMDDASPVSLGAAFLGDALTLEYAWRPVSGARGVHGVSLRFR